MNREKIEILLSDKLKEINFLEDSNILFGKQKYNDLTLGTYFIDYGDDNIEFDLTDYQEKHIASEFYNTSGNDQWNFYLIFLRDTYLESDKLRIEKDSIYTRKFVFTIDELENYFDYQKSDKAVDADIINLWKEKLKEVDLDEVYSNAPYAQAVPRFLANEVIKDEESNQVSPSIITELSIKRISRLKLNSNYRKYPINRDFSLGKVNLIKGVNGTGKTSFLEAIELSISGKNYSNPYSAEEDKCINAVYNDNYEFIDEYTPNNNAKYRQRDIAWYSSAYKSGNELYRAFNKYNFYDSDAAYNLSHDSDVTSLSKYLSSIALGPEFNRIQDRLFGFKERLLKENNNRKNEIAESKKNIKEASQIIDSVKLKSNPEDKFKTFIEYSKEIKWTKKLPNKYEGNYNDFIEDYHTSESFINALNQFLPTIKLRTKKSWEDELKKLQNTLIACDKIKIEIEIDKKNIESNNEILSK
ncbi:MAG: AAA family ATPase, partial [Ignavibacteriae bacterium]|nr:AAA family ATPase [Ignavibacteriota bacterium]